MDNRTNFVKIENLPEGMDGEELHHSFDLFGELLDMTAISSNSVILTYAMRSAAKNCKDIIDQVFYVRQNQIRAEFYYPKKDPNFGSNTLLQGLGANIAKDNFVYNYRSFISWSSGNPNRSRASGAVARTSATSGAVARTSATNGAVARTSATNGAVAKTKTKATGQFVRGKIVIGGNFAAFLNEYSDPWRLPSNGADIDECPICLNELGDYNDYDIYSDESRSLSLKLCNHAFHQGCLVELLEKAPTHFLQCPICKKVYGTRTGTRPLTGTISHQVLDQSLAGYQRYKTIEITFSFTNGIQGPEHPNPGQNYFAAGFPRKAYLPDCEEGILGMHGIYLAWEHRLMFTVGQSVSTSKDNVITWNDIHMKTALSGGDHGYPDQYYLLNLLDALNGFGITDASIREHMAKYPNLKNKGAL